MNLTQQILAGLAGGVLFVGGVMSVILACAESSYDRRYWFTVGTVAATLAACLVLAGLVVAAR